MNITKKYQVTFNVPSFNAIYTFERRKSSAFAYGNQSAVIIYENGKHKDYIDTRYDKTVMSDFGAWCEDYLSSMFDPAYDPEWKEI